MPWAQRDAVDQGRAKMIIKKEGNNWHNSNPTDKNILLTSRFIMTIGMRTRNKVNRIYTSGAKGLRSLFTN